MKPNDMKNLEKDFISNGKGLLINSSSVQYLDPTQ